MSPGDWVGVAGVAAVLVVPIFGGLWKVASSVGSMSSELRDHGRRLEVIETALVDGPGVAKRQRNVMHPHEE